MFNRCIAFRGKRNAMFNRCIALRDRMDACFIFQARGEPTWTLVLFFRCAVVREGKGIGF